MPDRTACKYCGKVGFIRRENVIKAGRATTSFYCGSCNRTWEETEEGTAGSAPNGPRDDERKR